jgi:hypothetical protein
MHTALNRLQNTFGFFTTCCAITAGLISLMTVFPWPEPTTFPKAVVGATDIQVVKGRPHYSSPIREQYAQIRFNLDADLTSLFTWNTKQLFVYVTAEYPNTVGGISEAVIWDTIIAATDSPYSFQNLKAQYWEPYMGKVKSKRSAKANKAPKTAKTTDLVLPGLIKLKNSKPKYHITDPSGVIAEKSNVTLKVRWNVQPWVGFLLWDQGLLGPRVGAWTAGKEGISKPFDFPPIKGTKPPVVKDDNPQTPEAGQAVPAVEI